MKTIKRFIAVILTAGMVMNLGMTVMAAGQWKQNSTGWQYQNDDNTFTKSTWQWIDGKCYYFDANGIMLANTTTPDGYTVDGSGAWTVDGVVQTQGATVNSGVNHSAGYDPVHPLAGKMDEWNLRLSDDNQAKRTISSWNVNAMLTGQMDQYFAASVGEYVDSVGNHIYTTQEDYDAARKTEQDLYAWFCNWLNSMDFENMSEMDKAKEIKKVLGQCRYQQGNVDYSEKYHDDYAILINQEGKCSEFAMTVLSLAKALGLKSGLDGSIDHSWYYIQVDGKVYSGQNQVLSLDFPINRIVYLQ